MPQFQLMRFLHGTFRLFPGAWRIVRAGHYVLYSLALVPFLTDLVETNRLPSTPREWTTEVVAGGLIALLAHKLSKEHRAVGVLARMDGLTGLWNRRAFNEVIEDECARARRLRQPLSLIYIDLDDFKQINDGFGHDAGDVVLRHVAMVIDHVIRARVDRGFRLGGDEFALLLPGSAARHAAAVVARIRAQCVHVDPVRVDGALGVSAGIVELHSNESANQFVQRADAAMYEQKHAHPALP